jgi:hypothetical protein
VGGPRLSTAVSPARTTWPNHISKTEMGHVFLIARPSARLLTSDKQAGTDSLQVGVRLVTVAKVRPVVLRQVLADSVVYICVFV